MGTMTSAATSSHFGAMSDLATRGSSLQDTSSPGDTASCTPEGTPTVSHHGAPLTTLASPMHSNSPSPSAHIAHLRRDDDAPPVWRRFKFLVCCGAPRDGAGVNMPLDAAAVSPHVGGTGQPEDAADYSQALEKSHNDSISVVETANLRHMASASTPASSHLAGSSGAQPFDPVSNIGDASFSKRDPPSQVRVLPEPGSLPDAVRVPMSPPTACAISAPQPQLGSSASRDTVLPAQVRPVQRIRQFLLDPFLEVSGTLSSAFAQRNEGDRAGAAPGTPAMPKEHGCDASQAPGGVGGHGHNTARPPAAFGTRPLAVARPSWEPFLGDLGPPQLPGSQRTALEPVKAAPAPQQRPSGSAEDLQRKRPTQLLQQEQQRLQAKVRRSQELQNRTDPPEAVSGSQSRGLPGGLSVGGSLGAQSPHRTSGESARSSESLRVNHASVDRSRPSTTTPRSSGESQSRQRPGSGLSASIRVPRTTPDPSASIIVGLSPVNSSEETRRDLSGTPTAAAGIRLSSCGVPGAIPGGPVHGTDAASQGGAAGSVPPAGRVVRRVTVTRVCADELEDLVPEGPEPVEEAGGVAGAGPGHATPRGADVRTQPDQEDVESQAEAEGGSDDEFWDARSWASTASWGPALTRPSPPAPALTPPAPSVAPVPPVETPLPALAAALAPAGPTIAPQRTLPGPAVVQPAPGGKPPLSHEVVRAPVKKTVVQGALKPPVTFRPDMIPPVLPKTLSTPKRLVHEPEHPVMFVDPGTCWRPIPAVTGLVGYWCKIPELSSPLPMPIDVMLGASWMVRKVHESIQGIKITEDGEHITVTARVTVMGTGIIHRETYPKDGTHGAGVLRRDVNPGRVEYRAYYTTQDELVLMMQAYSLSGALDHTGVEVLRLYQGPSGERMLRCSQACYCYRRKKAATQCFVGRWESSPPPKH